MARQAALPKDVEKHLKQLFKKLPYPVPVTVVIDKTGPEGITEAVRGFVDLFRPLSDKITFQEMDVTDPRAAAWGIDRAPALLFDPERYRIRYLGLPLGEEGRTFVETLLLVGTRDSALSAQSRKILGRLADSRNVRVFVSATCPYCPQQAVNAVKAAVERPDRVSVQLVDIQFNPDLAEKYSAFSVPQTFADDILIAQGAQPEELFMASLEKMEPQTIFIPESDAERIETDLVIVGGGPAGLTAGIYAVRSGLRAAVVERGTLGGQVATTPVVENYPGFARIAGKTLVDIIVAHAMEYVDIFPNEEVMDIVLSPAMEVKTNRRTFQTRAVLLATGATYRRLDVPGESRLAGRGVSFCSTCDGPLYKGKKALVIGGGNSAVTEALHLHHIGVRTTLVHRRDHLRAQDHLVKALTDAGIPVLWNTQVKEILGDKKVTHVELFNHKTGETLTVPADAVFIAVGYIPETRLAQAVGAALTPDGYIRHDGFHRTTVPGIYCAGDVEGGYKQIVTAVGAGAGAAMTIFEDLSHPYWTRS
uniref:FAD-dependent oxidoreductase n=1 Tax=Desulfacinum infernum TaxID=35837 RepID=A0A832A615_9BACT